MALKLTAEQSEVVDRYAEEVADAYVGNHFIEELEEELIVELAGHVDYPLMPTRGRLKEETYERKRLEYAEKCDALEVAAEERAEAARARFSGNPQLALLLARRAMKKIVEYYSS